MNAKTVSVIMFGVVVGALTLTKVSAQTMTPSPSPSPSPTPMSSTMPSAAPSTGYGPLGQ